MQEPPSITLRRGIVFWPADTLAVVLFLAALFGVVPIYDPLRPALIVAGVVVVATVLLLRRPRVELDAYGVRLRGQVVAWSDIRAIEEVAGLRVQYLRIRTATRRRPLKIRAVRASRIWPGRRYQENVAVVRRYALVAPVTRGTAWTYPAVIVLLLGGLVWAEEPMRYWLPRSGVHAVPAACAAGKDAAVRLHLTADLADEHHVNSHGVGTYCHWRGDDADLTVEVILHGRGGLLNGIGVARAELADEDRPGPSTAVQAVRLPADQWSIYARANDGSAAHQETILVAQQSNAVIVLVYLPKATDLSVPMTEVSATDPAGVAAVAAIASQILNAIIA